MMNSPTDTDTQAILPEGLTGPWQEAELLSGRHSAWQAMHDEPFTYSRTDLQHKHSSEGDTASY